MTSAYDADSKLEPRIQDHGKALVQSAQAHAARGRKIDRGLQTFIRGMMEDAGFRVNALRFVDVLPALDNDRDLVEHLFAYFDDRALPYLIDAPAGLRLLRKVTGNHLIAIAVRKAVRRIARYYMGGENLTQALRSGRKLRTDNMLFSFDMLGEAALSDRETEDYQRRYIDIIQQLAATTADWPHKPALDNLDRNRAPIANLSIKASSLSARIRPVDFEGSIADLKSMLRPVFACARKHRTAICLDMEQYEYKAIILASFMQLLTEPAFHDWPDAGIAMQAYLKDSEQDLKNLLAWAEQRGTPLTVRLVRGAYWDYEHITAQQFGWESPVWEQKWQTDQCYEACAALLLRHCHLVTPAIATHNLRSLAHAMAVAEQLGLGPDQFEFQMLYGMAPHLMKAVVDRQYRLRIYVPFGELIPGMAYLTRRLLENASSQSFRRMNMQAAEMDAELAAPAAPQNASSATVMLSETRPGFTNTPLHRFLHDYERNRFSAALAKARGAQPQQPYPLIIGGKAISGDKTIVSLNPTRPQQIIAEVGAASQGQARLAVAAAKQAFPAWAETAIAERAGVLIKAASLLEARRDHFAALEILEAGKTRQEADANITEAIDFLRFYAEQAMQLNRPGGGNTAGEINDHLYRPKGVGLVIPPWNFPLAILTGMLSATLVTGNTAILKPSSQTPVIAAMMLNLLHEAGLPAEVVQFVPGAGAEIGDFLVQHPDIHLIAFTGSLAVGRRILRLASQPAQGQRHFKHVVAEMGGKNAIIIDSDAEPDEAIASVVESAFGYQGQKCSAASRLIIVGDHYQHVLQRLANATRSLVIGDPAAPGTQLGPVISEAARQEILQAISRGKQQATLLLEMPVPDNLQGYFIGPVIFYDVPVDSDLFQEEIFGPVLSVTRAENLEQAIDFANHSHYALTGGLYSRHPAHIELARRRLEVGNLYINRKITRAFVQRQPFGGHKLSGLGSKAGGRDYLLQFTQPLTITENTLRRGYAPEQEPR